jgi:hypothetical protein
MVGYQKGHGELLGRLRINGRPLFGTNLVGVVFLLYRNFCEDRKISYDYV